MVRKKGTLQTLVDTVGEVIHAVGAEVGLVTERESAVQGRQPKSKAARKAAQKVIAQESDQAKQDANEARRAAHIRA